MKKIVLLMIMMLLFVPLVSAADWDNKLSYSESDLKVEISNSFLLLFKTSEIGTAELKSHSSVNEVRKVGAGNQVVMWYDFNFLGLYENGLGEVEFIDVKTGEEIDRNYSFVYWGETERDVYEDVCSKPYFCEKVFVRKETYETWLPYNSNDIPKGNIRIGLRTYVEIGDKVDGVWTITGKKIKKHSVWTAALNANLDGYYKLDETSGTNATDSTGNNSGTADSDYVFNTSIAGIINTAADFSDAVGIHEIDLGTFFSYTDEPFSINFWIYPVSITASDRLFMTTTTNGYGIYLDAEGDISWTKAGVDGVAGSNTCRVTTGSWQMVTVTYNGTGISFFCDGVLGSTEAYTTTFDSPKTYYLGNGLTLDTDACDCYMDEVGVWSRELIVAEVTQLWNGGAGISYTTTFVPSITLNSPVNAFNSTTDTIVFNGSVSSPFNPLANVSMILDGSYNGTNSSGINNVDYIFTRTLADGFYNWTMEACDDTDTCANATTRNFTIDSIDPLLNLINPTGNVSYSNGTTGVIEWTATDANIDTCWFEYAGINETVTCADNTSIFNLTASRDLIFWVNDTAGNIVSNVTTWDYLVLENAQTFNATTLETESETFYINISTNGFTPSIAKLIYNGTTYSSATITNIAGAVYNISRTIDIPITPESKPFFWNITVNGIEVQTQITNQTVNLTNFTHFSSGTPFINISFKNETLAEELVDAVIDSDWYYWLGSGGVVKTLSFTNASENAYYTFLLIGVNRTLNTNVSLTYSNSISQQRNYVDSDLELTNTTTELSLYLLPTADGIYVTFQVISIAEQPIAGVFSNVTRAGILISSGLTDDSGAIAYFLDPDRSYTFTFSKSGYDIYTTTLTPTQTTYTITLGQEAQAPEDDFTRGINYSFSPGITTLTNGTLTFFNFSLTSSYWDVSSFGFNLTNQDGTTVNTASALTNGGSIYVYHNTSNDTSLTMTYYWIVTGNTTTGSFTWVVFDGTGSGFGITTFFGRVTTYLSEGIFGLNTNSMIILIYLIIFVSVGIMSLKFGIRSPATIMMVLFGLSFLFEVHLELIPLVGGVPLLTTILGIVVSISLIREYLKI